VFARRAASVAAMFVGAVVGGLLIVHGHLMPALALLCAIVLATVAAYAAHPGPRAREAAA
jgi:uncharacterized membrane protein YoaK (UPF0700 family)